MKYINQRFKWLSVVFVFLFTLLFCNEHTLLSCRENIFDVLKSHFPKAPDIPDVPDIPIISKPLTDITEKVLKDKGKVAVFGGVLVAAYVGNSLHKYLKNEEDRKKHISKTQEALSTGKDQSWSNSDSKTSGEIRVTENIKKKEAVKLPVLKKKVKQVPPLEIIGETYKANKKLNVRGGPSAEYEKVGELSKDQNVNVVGKVKEKEWYFISHEGVGSGFVHANLLNPAFLESPDPTEKKLTVDDIDTPEVKTERLCRTIEQEITLPDGSKRKETTQACQGPNGWEVQS